MNRIYKNNLTKEERKTRRFQSCINSYYSILIIHLKAAISSYEKEDEYEAGLKFIQDSLEVVKQHDEETYESLKSELSLKIDSE
jgi:hypothetical protein